MMFFLQRSLAGGKIYCLLFTSWHFERSLVAIFGNHSFVAKQVPGVVGQTLQILETSQQILVTMSF
jgi:hypothetical protein